MNEDVFNMAVRKFLKKVGVTSQREIEQAARSATERGTLKNKKKVTAKMTLTIEELGVRHEIEDEVALE